MKFCKIFLFYLLLKCKDISTNAKEVTCREQALNNVQILMGHPGINTPYTSGHVLVFKCTDDNMKIYGQRTIECQSNGEWDNPYPQCGGSCREQELNNVQILMGNPGINPPYTSGHVLVFKCTDVNMKMYGQRTIECQSDGNWDNPYPQCGDKAQCSKPTTNMQFVTLSDDKNLFNNFESLKYKCNKPYDKIPGGTLMCKDEKWIGTIDCTSSICPPPPLIEDGDYNIVDKIDEVITKVSYSCQSYYVLNEQKRFYRCQDGRWETPPKCLKPCKFTPEIYWEYNIQPVPYDYIRHSDIEIKLYCKEGWNVGGFLKSEYMKVTCSDGKITTKEKCDINNIFG